MECSNWLTNFNLFTRNILMKSDQLEIYNNLKKLPKSKELADLYLADLYASAVRITEDENFPGRNPLVCHALREIFNRLPGIVGVGVEQRADFKKDIKPVIDEWEKEGMLEKVDSGIYEGNGNGNKVIPAPHHLMIITGKLLREQKGVEEKNINKTKSMICQLIPEWKEKPELAIPFITEWNKLGRGFVGPSHGKPLKSLDMETKFERFEQMLRSLLGQYLDSLKEIERIVTEANK